MEFSEEDRKKKYVVLEHLTMPDRGFRFWTTNSGNNAYSNKGELWYKEVLFTDDSEEAMAESQRTNWSVVPTQSEILDHIREQRQK